LGGSWKDSVFERLAHSRIITCLATQVKVLYSKFGAFTSPLKQGVLCAFSIGGRGCYAVTS
jgi:hypothetical protein